MTRYVIGPDGKVAYRELVDGLPARQRSLARSISGTEPDYDAMIAAAKRVAGT